MSRLSKEEFARRKQIKTMDKIHRKSDKCGKCTYINSYEPPSDFEMINGVLQLKRRAMIRSIF